jgi:hypothetical protein
LQACGGTGAGVRGPPSPAGTLPKGPLRSLHQTAQAGITTREKQPAPARRRFRKWQHIQGLEPADFDGPTAPNPGDYYLELGGSSYVSLWQFTVNFDDPSESKFSLRKRKLAFTPHGVGCSTNPPAWDNPLIPQEGTAQLLYAYPEQLMYRVAWRNLDGTEHLLANETVILQSMPAVVAGMVWLDIANPGTSDPTVAQEGLVSDPADVNSYWIGSVAEDQNGDIFLGFNASSGSMYPSIALAGPLDPGTPPEPLFLARGRGAQTNTSQWGTHADLSLDPTNDCIFWFTGEYVKNSESSYDWSTRIASFQLNTCNPAAGLTRRGPRRAGAGREKTRPGAAASADEPR